MLAFEQAKRLTHRMVDWFNSSDSDAYIHGISQRFNLRIKDDFTVRINSINMNCSICSVNAHGEQIAGCYHETNKSICYLDKALTHRPIGKKLIYHEMGHAIFNQIFDNSLSPQESFLKSEEVSMHIENTFPEFLEENLLIHHNIFDENEPASTDITKDVIKFNLVRGVVWGMAFSVGALLVSSLVNPKKVKKLFSRF